jgi:co-chaperonin GroES (HSP10)
MKRIELETGKAGIVIPNANELPKLIEGLIAAVGRGELDSQLQAVSMGRLGKG